MSHFLSNSFQVPDLKPTSVCLSCAQTTHILSYSYLIFFSLLKLILFWNQSLPSQSHFISESICHGFFFSFALWRNHTRMCSVFKQLAAKVVFTSCQFKKCLSVTMPPVHSFIQIQWNLWSQP